MPKTKNFLSEILPTFRHLKLLCNPSIMSKQTDFMLSALARTVSTFDNFTAGRPGLSWSYIINPPSHCALCRVAGGGDGLPERRLQAAQPGARRHHQHISLLSQCRCVAQRWEKLSTPAMKTKILTMKIENILQNSLIEIDSYSCRITWKLGSARGGLNFGYVSSKGWDTNPQKSLESSKIGHIFFFCGKVGLKF